MSAKLIQVIHMIVNEGDGTDKNPHRIVDEYYTPKGKHIVTFDNWEHEIKCRLFDEWQQKKDDSNFVKDEVQARHVCKECNGTGYRLLTGEPSNGCTAPCYCEKGMELARLDTDEVR